MVDREQVKRVAALARLQLSSEKEERLVDQLVRILEHVEQLREIDGLSAEELTHVAVVKRTPRADEPRPSLAREDLLSRAPESDGETFRVPAVIEGEGGA